MANWTKTSDSLPKCELGDRVIGIVRYRENVLAPIAPHIVVLVALRSGWYDVEDNGHTIHDCELWTMERDLVGIADVM